MTSWAKVVAVLAIFGAGVMAGDHYRDAKWTERWLTRNAEDAERGLEDSEGARAVEHQDNAAALAAADTHRKDEKDAQATTESTIAGIHDGTLRVREQLTCTPAPAPASTKPAASVATGSGNGGLRGTDAEFLVRFADQCDTIARDFNYCKKELERVVSTCQK